MKFNKKKKKEVWYLPILCIVATITYLRFYGHK